MSTNLPSIYPARRTGNESFHIDGRPLGFTLLDFWSWSFSDLVNNAIRGVLAEFIVACALGVDVNDCRDLWSAFDLVTPEKIRVEVKSAAYIQSWEQQRLSSIVFNVRKTRTWTAETNVRENISRRQAHVYVFALLAYTEKSSIDPLNINQWRFYVLSTRVLDERTRSQNLITLKSLEVLAGESIPFDQLREAVLQAVGKNST